jgi:outer membrane immunogenic protein
VEKQMKTAIVGAFATILGASAVSAADLESPSFKDPSAPVSFDARWSGFYAGGHAGFAVGKSTDKDLSPVVAPGLMDGPLQITQSATTTGPVYGGYFGYNWQTGPMVLGLEASFSGTDLSGSWTLIDPVLTALPFAQYDVSHDVNWLAGATARLGFAQGRVMIYGLGGLVWGNDDTTFVANFFDLTTVSMKDSVSRLGWTAGLGIEYAVSDRVSTRIEYSHTDFSGKEIFGGSDNVDVTFDAIKFGASYKLSGGALAMTPLE